MPRCHGNTIRDPNVFYNVFEDHQKKINSSVQSHYNFQKLMDTNSYSISVSIMMLLCLLMPAVSITLVPAFPFIVYATYKLISLKCQISVIWLVETACIFLIFFIFTVQISMEFKGRKIEAGKNNSFGKQKNLKNSKQSKLSSVIFYNIYNTYSSYN